ncbi:MAG: Nif3-like dinuclear metal center hexameric protein [Lachnospiraceae bacterium]|nr:Nif3-like dinuclear metal center hexameric protein [Lachnospiraceae bacterium]
MKIEKVIEKLAKEYPPQTAMSWDNPGLQVGRTDRSVKKIYVALDATDQVIQECISWKADLLVTHHPLLMSGIKKVNSEDYPGRKVLAMAESGIAHYAMHTNYDVIKMSELAEKALRLKKTKILEVTGAWEDGSAYGIGGVGNLPKKMTARECCEYVKKAFDLKNVRLFGNPETEVRYLAVSPGSGKSMIGPALAAGADILVTGDIGHHDGLDAVDQGLPVIDAGHYGIEHLFIRQMADFLKEAFPELKIREAKPADPFTVF